MNINRTDGLLSDIKHYFGFLLDQDYQIQSVRFLEAFGDWDVTLESSKSLIEIYTDRSQIMVVFIPDKADRKLLFSLEAIIYFLSKGQNFIGHFDGNLAWGKKKQFERLSNLLRQYNDQISSFFSQDYGNLKDDLLLAQAKYGERLSKEFSQKQIAEQKLRAWISLFLLPFGLVWIGLLVYFGWQVSVAFIIGTDLNGKPFLGALSLLIILLLFVSISRILNSILWSYNKLKK
jgi:hypothetical protein